jgi:hypothetical protein
MRLTPLSFRSSYFAVLSMFMIFAGCSKRHVQVFETKSLTCHLADDYYAFENDTVLITYNFWSEKGFMEFAIFNKLNIPIYVDWKKSSYIDNKVKLNYWSDDVTTTSVTLSSAYYYKAPFSPNGSSVASGGQVSYAKTVKEERITFIPPSSSTKVGLYYILPITHFALSKNAKSRIIPRSDNPKLSTVIYFEEFDMLKSPVTFRNFMTLSTSEGFETQFYVDNQFSVTKVIEVQKKHFEYTKLDENRKDGRFFVRDEYGNIKNFSDYMRPSSFYITIPTFNNMR